jgi:hypothetical protein
MIFMTSILSHTEHVGRGSYKTYQACERLIGKVLQQIKTFYAGIDSGLSGVELRHNLFGIDVNLRLSLSCSYELWGGFVCTVYAFCADLLFPSNEISFHH